MRGYFKYINWSLLLLMSCLMVAQITHAQSESIKSARRDVFSTINELTDVKSQSLTPDQKQAKEAEIKKITLEKILNLSILETDDLKNKINNLADIESELVILRDDFNAKLENYLGHFEGVKLRLKSTADLEMIENIAGDFQTWRATNYDPEIQDIFDFILTFQNKNLLKIADQRLSKISFDIKKIKPTSIKLKNNLNQTLLMLNKGALYLVEARNYNLRAIKILLERLPSPNADTNDAELTKTPKQTIITENNPQITADANEHIKISQKTIKDLIGDSLNQIKEAYKLFFEITTILNK